MTTSRIGPLYYYVGPAAIRDRARSATGGTVIRTAGDLRAWLASQPTAGATGLVAATFVIDPAGFLRLADRRSEHVACAGGGPVLTAGEMFFAPDPSVIEEVSNLSTGYCPEPKSWDAVARALAVIGVGHPGRFTTEIVFRRCPACDERNVVKDGWFVCQVCGGDLPADWNFGDGTASPEPACG
jgi:hypothetical protein